MSPLWMYYIKYFSLRQMLFFPFTEKKRNILLVYWFRAKERDSRIANFFSRITWKFLPKPFGLPAVKQWLKVLLQNVKDDVDFWKFLNGIYFKDEGGRHFEAQGLFFSLWKFSVTRCKISLEKSNTLEFWWFAPSAIFFKQELITFFSERLYHLFKKKKDGNTGTIQKILLKRFFKLVSKNCIVSYNVWSIL